MLENTPKRKDQLHHTNYITPIKRMATVPLIPHQDFTIHPVPVGPLMP